MTVPYSRLLCLLLAGTANAQDSFISYVGRLSDDAGKVGQYDDPHRGRNPRRRGVAPGEWSAAGF